MSKSYAWRPLAILHWSACTVMNDGWLRHQRLELYHQSMYHIIADLNRLCSSDIYLRFADGVVRLCSAFYHLLVMDVAEVAAALLCDVNQCPVCTCPHKVNWIAQTVLTLFATLNHSKRLSMLP